MIVASLHVSFGTYLSSGVQREASVSCNCPFWRFWPSFMWAWKKGLVLNLMNAQVAMFLCYRGHIQGVLLAARPDILCCFWAVKQLRPPCRQLVLQWDLNLALSALTQVPFEPANSATLKDIMLKAVFLVAICSAR